MKRIILLSITLLSVLLQCGCWNYRGLNELAIASGIAIDKGNTAGTYTLTAEIVDLTTTDEGTKQKILTSEGKTIFECARNIKRKSVGKLYFSNTQLVVVSEELASTKGIYPLMDFFLRDIEAREQMNVVIFKGGMAKNAFENTTEQRIISYDISKIIQQDNKVSISTVNMPMYKANSVFSNAGSQLVLPAVKFSENDSKPTLEVNGVAVFKRDKIVGYLTPEETKFFLMATDQVKGGILVSYFSPQNADNVSLEIKKSDTKRKITYENNKYKVTIKINIKAALAEIEEQSRNIDEAVLDQIERNTEEIIVKELSALIEKVQNDFNSDIFGFGELLHKSNPKQWKEVKEYWPSKFSEIEAEIIPDVVIINAATTKKI